MKRKNKKLTRLILTALVSAGGVLLSLPSVTAAQDTTVDDARVAADSAEGYAVYGNNTGDITDLKDDAASDPVGNTITVNTTKTLGSVYGGHSRLAYGYSVSGNIVNMEDGSISIISGGSSTNSGNVMDNTVNVSGGTVGMDVYGGVSGSGNVTGNVVNISGGKINENVGNVYGGAMGVGASSSSVSGNTIVISGGTINGNVYGGYTDYFGGDVTGNTVTIEGGTFATTTMIYGGLSLGSGNIANNTVNILTAINVAHIMGGDGTTVTGNTLNVNAIGVTVGDDGVYGFQNMNFFLPDGAAGKTMLTVNEKDAYGDGKATDLSGVAIGAAVQAGATFAKGDTVNLITNPSGLTTDGTTTMKQITDKTVTIQTKPTPKTLTTDQSYELELAKTADETTIVATVKDVKETPGGGGDGPSSGATNDGLKSPVETRAAVTTFVNAGTDMLASQGFAQAANAVALDMAESAKTGAGAPNVGGFTPFAAFGGSSMRAESGSHVDTKGFGLNIGFARELPNSQGKLLFGPVVEYGGGSYDSYNNDVHGEGGAHYFGVGLMARQVNHDGFYYEGSVRGGRVTSDYKSFDVRPGNKVEYDSSSNYWAAHLGVGKVFAAGKQGTVDGYLKYFYSHQGGDDTDIKLEGGAGERVSFDAINSNRIRIGARYTHKINEMNSLYGGLAYQYEFGGEARAHYSTSGVAPSPSVKGSSGMLELGWQVKPGGPLTLDLGFIGWAGKQRGGSVQLGATWSF